MTGKLGWWLNSSCIRPSLSVVSSVATWIYTPIFRSQLWQGHHGIQTHIAGRVTSDPESRPPLLHLLLWSSECVNDPRIKTKGISNCFKFSRVLPSLKYVSIYCSLENKVSVRSVTSSKHCGKNPRKISLQWYVRTLLGNADHKNWGSGADL